MLLPLLWADVFYPFFDVALIVSLLLFCVVNGKPLEGLADVIVNVTDGKPL